MRTIEKLHKVSSRTSTSLLYSALAKCLKNSTSTTKHNSLPRQTKNPTTCKAIAVKGETNLSERLKQVGARDRHDDVYLVNNVEGFVLSLIQEEGKVVRNVQLFW